VVTTYEHNHFRNNTDITAAGFALSLIGMGFAAAGHISPVQAALFEEFIDVLAIANALRLSLGKRIETDMNR